LLLAAAALRVEPARCVYVGDDLRDVQAGRAAGMTTIAATYGYLGNDEPVEAWGADVLIAHPADLFRLIP
jgi:phosphoglycolate phosphatase